MMNISPFVEKILEIIALGAFSLIPFALIVISLFYFSSGEVYFDASSLFGYNYQTYNSIGWFQIIFAFLMIFSSCFFIYFILKNILMEDRNEQKEK